jgi:hypothetical protein
MVIRSSIAAGGEPAVVEEYQRAGRRSRMSVLQYCHWWYRQTDLGARPGRGEPFTIGEKASAQMRR